VDRAEQTGLGVAVIGHLALFGALSLGLLSAPKLPKLDSQPVEVTLSTEVDLQSATPAPAPPAPVPPAPAPVVQAAPPEPAPAPVVEAAPPPPIAKPEPKPTPKPEAAPKPSPKVEAKPKPDKKVTPKPLKVAVAAPDPTARRRPGLSNSIVAGLADAPTPAKATKPVKAAAVAAPTGISAAQITGAQKASLNSLLYSQLKPHWKPPSGADAELLVTKLSVHLNKDGSLSGDPEVIGQDGINDSNRAQAKLHAERAIQAVRRAAPFNLPQDYYEAWKWLKPLKLYVGQPG
jgi:outer membrane biosynthesis protein TonB